MKLPDIDNAAPDFNLLNQRGETVRLADFKGKQNVALYFYPKAMTPGCTTQACGIRDSKKAFETIQTVVLGVSPDKPARLQKFEDRDGLNFDLLSDEDHQIADAYGVWGEKKFMGREYMGVHRMTFIIDKQGVLRHVFSKVNTKTHHDDVLAWISENLQ
jgi:peroxiredoxin Q/BCP